MDIATAVKLLALAAEVGIPAVQNVIKTFEKDTVITSEDVDKLAELVKKPEEYFKK